ncbi:MAG: hypothetical protein Q8N78_09875 [Sulfurimonas sp.]|nr:hypothetical protein [Sulfurimonas sp.]
MSEFASAMAPRSGAISTMIKLDIEFAKPRCAVLRVASASAL